MRLGKPLKKTNLNQHFGVCGTEQLSGYTDGTKRLTDLTEQTVEMIFTGLNDAPL